MQHVIRRSVRAIVMPLVVLLLLTAAFASPAHSSPRDRLRASFFGVDISIGTAEASSWPAFSPGAVRVALGWDGVELSPGSFNWGHTDIKVATAEEHGAKPLIVLQNTPRFHALDASNATVASAPRLPAFGRFVRTLVARYGSRADYQVWNEPNVPNFYTGTPAHMAQMTKIVSKSVRKLAPDATVVAPSFPLRGERNDFRVWFRDYWSQRVDNRRVAHFVDVANVSAYPMPEDGPEQGIAITRWARKTVAKYGFRGPLWASEINYGANGLAPTRQLPARSQAAFVIRTYALHANLGADRVYWWRWERHQTVNTQLQDVDGNLTRAGTAFGVVKEWLLDTRPKGCSLKRGVRTCRFKARGGIDRVVVWTRSGKPRSYRAPSGALTLTNAIGAARDIGPRGRMPIGLSPVMIEVTRN